MKEFNIGIMQGRLTMPKGRGIQFFPFENWEKEFYLAQEIGLDEIEWIIDYPQIEMNPFFSENGVPRLAEVINETGVVIKSVCFDYFMRRAFYKDPIRENELKEENYKTVDNVLSVMKQIGATILEIPVVDESKADTKEKKEKLKIFLHMILERAEKNGIDIGLETDFPPSTFSSFLGEFKGWVFANYDTGNSSGIGYNPVEELEEYGNYIKNIHIKDRVYKGTTVELGAGSADFDSFFKKISKIGYDGSFILQACRGEEGKEKEQIIRQVEFLKKYINRYCAEN